MSMREGLLLRKGPLTPPLVPPGEALGGGIIWYPSRGTVGQKAVAGGGGDTGACSLDRWGPLEGPPTVGTSGTGVDGGPKGALSVAQSRC